jgi:para-nitrobenzyl esterase
MGDRRSPSLVSHTRDGTPPMGPILVRGLSALAASLIGISATAGARPLLETAAGPVLGVERAGVETFMAIPYAAPPVGPLRLRPPQPVASWTQPRDGGVDPPACPQAAGSTIGKASEQEDCLYLNVWAPARRAGRPLPVMVWIHGSGVKGYGGSPFFSGFHLAHDDGVVVVTINYRLGLLGGLVSPALDGPGEARSGNYWLLDQQAALRWVQANAIRFGGNPKNITVFGESAGGASVLALLSSPASSGLFQRAIVESSGGAQLISRATAEGLTHDRFLPALGCSGSGDVAACLRAAPVSAFLHGPDAPIRVQDDALLPMDPLAAFESGAFMRMPVLIGTNAEEGRYIVAQMEHEIGRRLTAADYAGPAFAGGAVAPGDPVGAAVSAALANYPTERFSSPEIAASRLITDVIFACPSDRARRTLAAYVPVYGYEFTEPDPVQEEPLWARTGIANGPYHTSEEAYLFDGDQEHRPLTGRAARLSHMIRAYWTAFARTGDPNGSGRSRWPLFSSRTPQLLDLQEAPRLSSDFADSHNCRNPAGAVAQR